MFEDFSSDALEDAKYILISHLGELSEVDFIGGDLQVEMSESLKERIRVYTLQGSPNVRDLRACEEHLREETEGVFWNVNLDWYSAGGKVAIIGIGGSVEEFLGEWLRERFSGMKRHVRDLEKVGERNQIFYLDKNGSGVLYYYENDRQDKSVYVSFQKIWGFFQTILCLEDSQIRKILHSWILEEFGLDLEPKMW